MNRPTKPTIMGSRSTRSEPALGDLGWGSNGASTSQLCSASSESRKPAAVPASIGAEERELHLQGGQLVVGERLPQATGRSSASMKAAAASAGAIAFQRSQTYWLSTAVPVATTMPISAPLPRWDRTWATIQSEHIDGAERSSDERGHERRQTIVPAAQCRDPTRGSSSILATVRVERGPDSFIKWACNTAQERDKRTRGRREVHAVDLHGSGGADGPTGGPTSTSGSTNWTHAASA